MPSIDKLHECTNNLLEALGGCSLDVLAQSLPSPCTTDINVDAGEEILKRLELSKEQLDATEEEKYQWEAFHQFSQSHSTLFHHRFQQKALRLIRSHKKNKKGSAVDSLEELEEHGRPICNYLDTKNLITSLPSGWCIVMITVGTSDYEGCAAKLRGVMPKSVTLHVSRVTTGPKASIVIHSLPSCPTQLIAELTSIKEQNVLLNKSYSNQPSQYSALRSQLDDDLKAVVSGMEASWLGAYRCLLTGTIPEYQKCYDAIKSVVQKFKPLTHRMLSLFTLAVCCPAVQLFPNDPIIVHSLRYIVSLMLGESSRSVMVKQVTAALDEHRDLFRQAQLEQRGHLILTLDKTIECMAWESMKCLKDHSVTRMPCLHCIHILYQTHCKSSVFTEGIDCSKGFYLLDPDNNLPRTQQKLVKPLKDTEWSGVTASRPDHQHLKAALQNSDLFMYIGHGSGSQYLPGDLVEELQCRAAVMLYGCSSVRLQPRGRVADPWGVLFNYLLAKCPCVVGMLYEVTDKDTDLLTNVMLEFMMKARTGGEIYTNKVPAIVAYCREFCKRYLTAAAYVVYGLPLRLKTSKK